LGIVPYRGGKLQGTPPIYETLKEGNVDI